MLLDNVRQALCDIRIEIARFDAVFELLYPESLKLFILLHMEFLDGDLLFPPSARLSSFLRSMCHTKNVE